MTKAPPISTGDTFSRLTTISEQPTPAGRSGAHWLCKCQCGNEKIIKGALLKSGAIKSCGCLLAERLAAGNVKHGMRHSKEYHIWLSMCDRCRNPNARDYSKYGGRGIRVCDRWMSDFRNFIEDMGNRPDSRHSIDRIDNDGDYEPGNCEWRIQKDQCRNKRNNLMLTFRGETRCLAEWCELLHVDYSATHKKLQRRNWDMERLHSDGKLFRADA